MGRAANGPRPKRRAPKTKAAPRARSGAQTARKTARSAPSLGKRAAGAAAFVGVTAARGLVQDGVNDLYAKLSPRLQDAVVELIHHRVRVNPMTASDGKRVQAAARQMVRQGRLPPKPRGRTKTRRDPAV